jgi:hypothetical protein
MFRTVKSVRQELERRGGYLETIRDTESPEYAPHLSMGEQGWPHGAWIKNGLLLWASEHLTQARPPQRGLTTTTTTDR